MRGKNNSTKGAKLKKKDNMPLSGYGQEGQYSLQEVIEIRDACQKTSKKGNDFDYPDYGGLPSSISDKLTGDEVDALQEGLEDKMSVKEVASLLARYGISYQTLSEDGKYGQEGQYSLAEVQEITKAVVMAHLALDGDFEYPLYGGLPKKIINKLTSDEVDALQESGHKKLDDLETASLLASYGVEY